MTTAEYSPRLYLQATEATERHGLAVLVAKVAEQVQGLPQTGARRRVVARQLLRMTQIQQRVALPNPVTGLPVPGESLPEAGR